MTATESQRSGCHRAWRLIQSDIATAMPLRAPFAFQYPSG